jgi:hypothetical protein
MYDKLEYELLLFGVDHCKKVADENENNQESRAIADMALRDGERLSQALANYFTTRMAQSTHQPSVESTT